MLRARLTILFVGVCLFLIGPIAGASITAAQIDNFQDNTTDNWGGGDQLATPTGGPLGTADLYLQLTSSGGGGSGSKIATINSLQWSGNYSAAGVTGISLDLLNPNTAPVATPLSIRIVLFGATGSRWSSTVADVLPADNQWHHEVFSFLESSLTQVMTGDTYGALITNVNQLQIRYDAGQTPSSGGTVFAGMLGIDNITATGAILAVPQPAHQGWIGLVGAMLLAHRLRRCQPL